MISGATSVVALLGRPVAHSGSPQLHNGWFAKLGLDWVYVALEVPEGREEAAVGAVRTLGLRGANVTAPLKERVVGGVDRLDTAARTTGAVNTLWWEGAALVGGNTDVAGLLASLRTSGVEVAGRRAAVIGTGGAARAATVALASAGAKELRIVGRDPERAERVRERCAAAFPAVATRTDPLVPGSLRGVELLVNAASGRVALLDELSLDVLDPHAAWVDLNYWDRDPPGLGRAAAAGFRTVTGDGMLKAQAALSFEAWTGLRPDG
ncbi:MAG: shikimate dehydrogenase [Alphaproteobacteria bacterium]|nr:shikimate dehydrogenase [Alphaproteobacteria bacterium]MCB9695285.1 shikimate dehydrogenase [Alphaproteobacteria bacterium]